MTYDHTELLGRLSCRGYLDQSVGTVAGAELAVMGDQLDRIWLQRDALLDEVWPSEADSLLTRWEEEFQIFWISGKTAPERIAAVLARFRLLPNFRPATIEEILTGLCGYTVDCFEPFAFRCNDADSVCDDPDDVLDGEFLFYLLVDEADARDGNVTRAEIDYLTSVMKPAHTQGMVRCDDFLCEDPWSVTDLDLLGV